MKIKSFFIDCTPPRTTHQAGSTIMMNKFGKPFVGQNKKGKATKQLLKTMLFSHTPPQPYETPLRVQIMFRFPMRKNEKKALRDREAIPCDKRPDCDNLAKGLLDAMQGDFFLDDAQIYDLKITKLYAQRTGIGVTIKAIDQTSFGHFPLY
jgi:Holliday junction resolvase RusA-like endonuclease